MGAAKKQHEMTLKDDDDDGGGSWSAEGVCAPKSWYLMGSMGNLRAKTKIAMLHSPITSLKDSHVDKKYLVTLRVLLLATTSTASSTVSSSSSSSLFSDLRQYTVISAVRSSAFAVGSTRSLR